MPAPPRITVARFVGSVYANPAAGEKFLYCLSGGVRLLP
jgi:hypothetical protein